MLSFSEDFNTAPPKIHFMTVPFHPNGRCTTDNLWTDGIQEQSLCKLLCSDACTITSGGALIVQEIVFAFEFCVLHAVVM